MTDYASENPSRKYFEGVLTAYSDCLGLLELSENKAPGLIDFLISNGAEERDARCISAGMSAVASALSDEVRAKIANIELLISSAGEA